MRILFTVLFGLCLSAIAPMLLAGLLRLGQVQPDFDVAELDRHRMSTPALHPIFIDPLNGSR